MTGPIRTFIAIDLPPNVKQALSDFTETLKSRGLTDIRWVRPGGIHLTLKFLGNIPPDMPPRILSTLQAAAKDHAPFNLSLGNFGVFPNPNNPRPSSQPPHSSSHSPHSLSHPLHSSSHSPRSSFRPPHSSFRRKPEPRNVAQPHHFPNNPRVLWVGLNGDLDALSQLQSSVEAHCRTLGFDPDQRPFRPHLTLGRVRRTLPPPQRALIQTALQNKTNADSPSWTIHEIHLIHSTLTPKGAIYRSLGAIPLH